MRPRCVITGIGAVSAVGVGIDEIWDSLCAGRSGIAPVVAFDTSEFSCPFGGEALVEGKLVSARDYVPKSYRKATKVMARDTELAVVAASLAAKDAGLITREAGEDSQTTYPAGRVGCHIGAGFIAAETDELTSALVTARDDAGEFSLNKWGESGIGNLQPLWLLKYLPNMLACHVTIIHGCEGPSNTITCTEASGLLSLGESMRVIERGDATACFSGGIENKVNPMGIARMSLVGRFAEIPTGTDEPWRYVKPYDEDTSGAVPGEGGGIVILEEKDSARSRNARVYAELLGIGSAQSQAGAIGICHQVETCGGPAEDADEGLADAIAAAIRDAGITASQVDAIVPAACGVTTMDKAELGGLEMALGEAISEIPLVTLTPFVGQLFSGAGALAIAVGAKAISEQRLPARLHGGNPDTRSKAEAAESSEMKLDYVLVCTGSLSGQAAAVVLGRVD
jgi:3-oxoacyl-[acyl-carrier-protein] synthase II